MNPVVHLHESHHPARSPRHGIGGFRAWAIAAIVLANLFALTLGASALLQGRDLYRERAELVAANYAEVLEARIIEKIRVVDDAMLRAQWEVERQLQGGAINGNQINTFLERQTSQLPEILGLRVIDADGVARWGKDVKAAGGYLVMKDRDHFKAHASGGHEGLYVARPFLDRTTQTWAIPLSRAYRHPDGRFAGVVGAGLKVGSLEDMLRDFDIGRLGSLVLRHADMGLVTRHPPIDGPAGQPGHDKVSAEFKALIEAGQPVASFHTANTPDGIERTYAFRRLPGLPLTLAVGMAHDEYLATWRQEVLRVGLLLATFFLTTLIGAWLIRRYWLLRKISVDALADRKSVV